MVIAVAHPSVLLHKRDLGQDVHVCVQVCMCGCSTLVNKTLRNMCMMLVMEAVIPLWRY